MELYFLPNKFQVETERRDTSDSWRGHISYQGVVEWGISILEVRGSNTQRTHISSLRKKEPPFWHVPQPRGTKATSPVFIPRKILPSCLFFHPCSSSTSSSLRGFRGRKLSGGGGLGDEGEKAVKLATELATFSHYGYLSLSKFSWRRENPQISGDIRSLILD